MYQKNRAAATLHSLPSLLLLVVLGLANPQTGRADAKPVTLDRLNEKEAIRLIDQARSTDVFLFRGRRVAARTLQEELQRGRRSARSEALRAGETGRTFHTDDLAIARLRAQLTERSRAEQAKARFDLRAIELRRSLPPDSPEIRSLSEEAARIAAAWISATPEERRTLEERSRVVVEQLRRLGVDLGR